MTKTIALVAHDARKDALVEWVGRHINRLDGVDIVATGTTGGKILQTHESLRIVTVKSGPLGGDQQIGAMIADGKLDGLVFFVDPLSPMPHDVDIKALMRLAAVYDLPLATSPSTADAILDYLL